jgi:hypothetical protein
LRKLTAILIVFVLVTCAGSFGYWYLRKEAQRHELQPVYENYLAVMSKAYEDFDTSSIKEVAARDWADTLSDHINSREQDGIVLHEVWKLRNFRVLDYSALRATVQGTREYLPLGVDEKAEDYPDYYWRSEIMACDLIQEEGRWKVEVCRYVLSDW